MNGISLKRSIMNARSEGSQSFSSFSNSTFFCAFFPKSFTFPKADTKRSSLRSSKHSSIGRKYSENCLIVLSRPSSNANAILELQMATIVF